MLGKSHRRYGSSPGGDFSFSTPVGRAHGWSSSRLVALPVAGRSLAERKSPPVVHRRAFRYLNGCWSQRTTRNQLARLERLNQLRHDLVDVTNDPEVCYCEDRGLSVFVDGNDGL